MRRAGLLIAVATLLSGCFYTTEVTTRRAVQPSQVNVAYRSAPSGSIAAQVGALLNQERRAHGLGRLSYNRRLTTAATRHAAYLATQGRVLSHYGARGDTPMVRVKAQGYRPCQTAENLGMGQDSPAEIMRDWMASPGHRVNNLLPNIREYGIAVHPESEHWVLVVAAPGC